MKPQRIQRKRTKGYNMHEESYKLNGLQAISVTRPGRWGNPFPAKVFGHEKSVKMFKDIMNGVWYPEMYPYSLNYACKYGVPTHKIVKQYLGGKNLACWCKPGDPCHADVLLKIANQ